MSGATTGSVRAVLRLEGCAYSLRLRSLIPDTARAGVRSHCSFLSRIFFFSAISQAQELVRPVTTWRTHTSGR